MRKHLRLIPIVLVFLLAVILVRCAVNPVTGKKEIMLISEKMEIDMGREIDQGLRLEYGFYPDARMRSYVREIGRLLVPFTHRPQLQYHFAILDTEVENAFAAPGGYIYITRGLLALINSEAEMATVLAHELGHVNARHSARQMTRSILVTLGIALAGELSEDIRKITPVSMIAAQLLFLKYSRGDEYQADKLGIQYSSQAGYDAGTMAGFFTSLQRLSGSKGGGGLPNFLSTHPLTGRRIDRVRELVASGEYPTPEGTTPMVKRNDYLQTLNGLVYGVNPRHGYVEGQAFYHPDMRFQFRIPHGWKVQNTPLQVTMAPANENAVIILKAEDTTEALDSYSQKMMNRLTNPKVLQRGFQRVNGFNAFHAHVAFLPAIDEEEDPKDHEVGVRITCIRKSGTVFSFFSAAASKDYPNYRHDIERTISSFRQLNSPRHLNRKPLRIYIQRAGRNQSLGQFLSRMRVPAKLHNRIALLNAMELNQPVTRNQLIKLIR